MAELHLTVDFPTDESVVTEQAWERSHDNLQACEVRVRGDPHFWWIYHQAQSVDYEDHRRHQWKQMTFAKLKADETWLVFCTKGQSQRFKSSIDRTSLLDTLRERIWRLCDGLDPIDGVSAAPATATADAEYDPMTELEAGAGSSGDVQMTAGSKGQRRTGYYLNAANNCIVTLHMASRCPKVDPTIP